MDLLASRKPRTVVQVSSPSQNVGGTSLGRRLGEDHHRMGPMGPPFVVAFSWDIFVAEFYGLW